MIKRKKANIRVEIHIAIFMFLIGIAMMNLVPTWQTPDERTHLGFIGTEIGKDSEFAEKLYEDIELKEEPIVRNYDGKVDIKKLKEAMTEVPQYQRSEMLPEGIHVSVIRHLPATLGILLGIVLRIPTYWVLILGEIFSLIYYVLVCYNALRIMPIKKEVFAMLMLMPMALHQAASINYDAVVLPLCFLMVAYLFKIKEQDKIVLVDFMRIFAMWLIISYIKLPYCLLIFMLLVLPIDKIHVTLGKLEINGDFIRKVRIPVCIIGTVLIGIAVYCLRNVFYVEMIWSLIVEWKRSLYLFFQTGVMQTKSMIISSVGNFGWLDTPISFVIALIVYGLIFTMTLVNDSDVKNARMRGWDKFVTWGTFSVLCVFTTAAMINHMVKMKLFGTEWTTQTYDIRSSLYLIPYIGGIQGRYYLPFVSLLFLPVRQIKKIDRKVAWGIVAVFEIALYIYVIWKLLDRYWMI